MVNITEATQAPRPLAAALKAGLDQIDQNATVIFTQYRKAILPADGYVFWIATGYTMSVSGSLHVSVNSEQREDESIAVNRARFTTNVEIQALDSVNSCTLFIGQYGNRQFSFSSHDNFYRQADLWHYFGDAVYPALASQLLPVGADISRLTPIVSNSLPIWLALNAYGPVYPSFLVPDNLEPPYIACHIEPGSTTALQAAPHQLQGVTYPPMALGVPVPGQPGFWYPTSSQLVAETVRLTLYGFNNVQAMTFRDYIFDASIYGAGIWGIMNMPVIQDDKRTQNELNVIAQKKTIEFEIDYYQSAVIDIATRLILSATATITAGAN